MLKISNNRLKLQKSLSMILILRILEELMIEAT